MDTSYLVQGTNELYYAMQGREPDVAAAAAVGCRTLRRLADDESFYEALARLAVAKNQERAEFDRITGSVSCFVNEFVSFERQLLEGRGLDPQVGYLTLLEAERLLGDVRSWWEDTSTKHYGPTAWLRRRRLDPRQLAANVRRSVFRLAGDVCALEELYRPVNHVSSFHADSFKHGACAIGGLTIVALNAAMASEIGGPMSTVSVAAGGAVFGNCSKFVTQLRPGHGGRGGAASGFFRLRRRD